MRAIPDDKDLQLLTDKLALVTGSSRGLGAAIASGMAAHGARLILTDVDVTGAEDLARDLSAKGCLAEAHALDVTDRGAVSKLADDILSRFGGLDILVNNAGIAGWAAFDDPAVVALWDKVLDVNLEGCFNISHAFVPHLKAAKGNVVHLCSIAGFVSGGSTAGYVVSKGAIRSLTQVMARDLAPHGIRVNAIAPGAIVSEMAAAIQNRPGGLDWFTSRVMMKRMGEPSEVVAPVVFLASSMASYITGTTLPVDGGFLSA